jgi:hypothetical protein
MMEAVCIADAAYAGGVLRKEKKKGFSVGRRKTKFRLDKGIDSRFRVYDQDPNEQTCCVIRCNGFTNSPA